MSALLAASPILLVLVLMLAARLSAAQAGAAGLLLALVLAVGGISGSLGWAGVAGAILEGLFLSAAILWILFAALSIHQIQTDGGALALLRDALAGLTANRIILTLLVGWFFALFLEGVAGFGTPVALAAPILAGLGIPPVQAVAIALLGHAGGVAFGAVGTPVIAQELLVADSAAAIAAATGPLNGLVACVLMVAFALAARSAGEGPAVGLWPTAGLAAAAFVVPMVAIAVFLGPELPTVIGALAGGAVYALVATRRRGDAGGASVSWRAVAVAGAPYLAIVAVIVLTRMVAPLREVLSGIAIEWTLPGGFAGSFQPLFHPGSMLMLGLIAGVVVQRQRAATVASGMAAAVRRLVPVAIALVVMLSLSRVMLHAGMIDALARAAAAGTGGAWPLVAPAVGVLGSFVTGSATTSNILFTNLQATTATDLGLPVILIVAAQGVGAAIGNIISPLNVIAGAATVGLAGREGAIMARTLPACLACAAVAGAVVFALTWAGGP